MISHIFAYPYTFSIKWRNIPDAGSQRGLTCQPTRAAGPPGRARGATRSSAGGSGGVSAAGFARTVARAPDGSDDWDALLLHATVLERLRAVCDGGIKGITP
jgi:hypothetical protein